MAGHSLGAMANNLCQGRPSWRHKDSSIHQPNLLFHSISDCYANTSHIEFSHLSAVSLFN